MPRKPVGVYGIEPIALGVAIELAALALELVVPGEELIGEAGCVGEPPTLIRVRQTPVCLRHGAHSTYVGNSDG